MNMLQSLDPRMNSIKENSILSFNEAAKFPIDFFEFDVQVRPSSSFCIFSFFYCQIGHYKFSSLMGGENRASIQINYNTTFMFLANLNMIPYKSIVLFYSVELGCM